MEMWILDCWYFGQILAHVKRSEAKPNQTKPKKKYHVWQRLARVQFFLKEKLASPAICWQAEEKGFSQRVCPSRWLRQPPTPRYRPGRAPASTHSPLYLLPLTTPWLWKGGSGAEGEVWRWEWWARASLTLQSPPSSTLCLLLCPLYFLK